MNNKRGKGGREKRGQMSLRIPKAPKEEIEPGDKKEVRTERVGGEEKMEKGLRGICEPSQGGREGLGDGTKTKERK